MILPSLSTGRLSSIWITFRNFLHTTSVRFGLFHSRCHEVGVCRWDLAGWRNDSKSGSIDCPLLEMLAWHGKRWVQGLNIPGTSARFGLSMPDNNRKASVWRAYRNRSYSVLVFALLNLMGVASICGSRCLFFLQDPAFSLKNSMLLATPSNPTALESGFQGKQT